MKSEPKIVVGSLVREAFTRSSVNPRAVTGQNIGAQNELQVRAHSHKFTEKHIYRNAWQTHISRQKDKIDNDIKGSTSRIAKCSPREKQRDRGIRGLEDGLEECSIVGERLPMAGPRLEKRVRLAKTRLEKQIRRGKAPKHEMRCISFNSPRPSRLDSTRKLSRP
jgi:hypothetical protein